MGLLFCEAAGMIHIAGVLDDQGVQRCVRCGVVLINYNGAMVPVGSRPLGGWRQGAAVEVMGGFSGVTEQSPNCWPTPATRH